MSKKLSIMMLLMVLFAPWAANGQNTLTVCDGTGTNQYVPFDGFNADYAQHNQMIYPASSLEQMENGTISKMVFYFNSSYGSYSSEVQNNCRLGTWTISLGETTSTTLSSLNNSISLTQVYSGCMVWDHSSLTMTINFEEPYTYGGGNLLVDFNHESASWNRYYFLGITATGASYTYNSQRNFLPKTTFTYTPGALTNCPKPTLNPAEYIEEEQASFSWTENGTATNWVLQYSTSSDFSNATSVNRSGIPAMVISEFNPATTYYVRVKANCGSGDESRWSNVISFTTECGAISSIPWTEDFNSYSTTATSLTAPSNYPNDNLPNCWRFLNRSESSSTYPQVFLTSNTSYAVSGNCLFFKSSSTTPLYAILPEFTTDIAGLELSFTYRNEGTGTSNGTLYVSYMTDPNDASTFNTTDAIACAQTTTKTPMKVRFSNAPAGSYLAFKYQGGSSDNYYMAIDDVTVNVPATTTAIQIVNTVSDPTTQMTWDEFAQQVSNGNQFTNTIFTLMEDITITSQANQAGTDGKYFSGTFDGNGKTITVNMTATGKYCAPFFGVNNATIKNLVVTGSISSAYQGVGGICGVVYGYTTFTNCVSDVAITSTCNDTPGDANGWSTCGGFVGFSGGGDNPTFVGCAFTGSISAIRNNCGGFIGFHASRSGWSGNYGGRSTYTNCIFAPSSINISNTNNAVFTYGYSNGQYLNITVTNSYYNEAGAQMNVKQNSKQAYSITGVSPVTVAMSGPSTEYNVSGITAYATGLVYGGTIFAGDGDNVALNLEGSNSGVYQTNHGEITGSENPFTLSMTNYDTEISALTCPAPTEVAVSDITAHEATVNWEGTNENYIVKYRTAAYINTPIVQEGFNESATPSNWTQYTGLFNETTGTATLSSGSRWYFGNNNGVFDSHARTNVYSTYQAWLVTPSLTVGNGVGLSFDVALTKYSGTLQPVDPTQQLDDKFIVLISTDNKATWTVLRKWDNAGSAYVYNDIACSATGENITLDLSAYSGQTAYIAFYGESTAAGGDNYLHIDNVTLGTLIPAGEWQNVTSTETSVTLTGLAPETLYEVAVQSDCGEDGLSAESTPVTFTTEVSCPAPTQLTVSDITAHGATVSWDKIATQETGDITYNYTWVEHGGTPDWTLHGGMSAFDRWTNEEGPRAFAFSLDPETEYDFYVRRDCGEEGYSAEVMVSFTTTVACPTPTGINVSGISGHEAMVEWIGNSESYIVKYRTAAYMNGIDESFDSSSVPADWTRYSGLVNNVMAGTASLTSTTSGWNTNSYALGTNNMKVNIYGTSCNYWLVTPEFTIGEDFELNFDLALTDFANADPIEDPTAQADDRFIVLIYTNNAWTILREWNNSGSRYVYNNIATTGENVNINLSAYLGQTVKIAFYGESTANGGDNDMHIDNVYVGYPIPAGEWQTITVEDTIVALTGLAPETLYEVVIQGDCGEEGLSAESEPVTFTTDVACPAPDNLTVSDITAHGATVSWEKMATQATGTITYNYTWVEHGGTPDWTLHGGMSAFDRYYNPDPPFAFAFGLDPETEYDFYVRRNCDEDGYSAEVMVSFTTTVACPVPTGLTVSGITGHGATATWTGYSENYVVELGSYDYTATPITGTIQEENFEGGSMPAGWTHIGNGSVNMYSYSSHVHGGTYSLQFSGATSDNIVVLPQFAATPNSLQISFWSQAEGSSSGSFDIGYVTDASDASSFVAIQTYTYSQHSSYQYVENINMSTAPANARIAFRHRSGANNWYWFIDDITIKGPVYPMVWTEYTTDNPSYTFEGLSPETTYFVSVKGDCGEEGMSAMSDTISFITDVTCPAPHDLTTSDVTSNSAMLHWAGDAESYNVSYYKAYFFDSFEEDLSQWTVYHEGDESTWEWAIENPNNNSSDLSAHSGDFAVVAYGMDSVQADNWLISPPIELPSQATLKFWVMRSTYDDYQDEYEVRLSTTGNAIPDFTTVLKEKTVANSVWTEVVIDLSAYDGQTCHIAIHHDHYNGFFLMVDDFGIFGWSEPIATTDNSLLIEDLLPETNYLWKVQANCGEEDGLSQWSNIDDFTTLRACPVPFDLNVSEITANGATIAWTGYNDSYEIMVGEGLYMAYDFENHTISDDFGNSSSYPWTVVQEGQGGSYCMKSGNGGISNSTSAIEMTVDLVMDASLSFDFWSRGEGSNDTYDWDKSRFYIDGTSMFDYASHSSWESYSTTLTAGTHTLKWEYKKDGSTNPTGDCFYVDNIIIESNSSPTWFTYSATESPFILNDAMNILPESTYMVKIKGICGDEETEYSEAITFTTLDENTKIFVIEGEWSNGDNWVPVGVPSIEQDVILRAEATVFDIAEANAITIDDAGALTIEDGGQLKTNADVEATMKKFIIGYGTDYVETDNGYYLMTLPTAAPVSAADAGLLTEESDYDLYSWDRTATDEEWQNNHDGIDLQSGVGFLYANQSDMEMIVTAMLRNSSEPVVVTPSYDEVEHGGWNLCGNPFPCEAYITTDAEGMAFYRLVDNQLELIEGAIAPLEAFFVKATAAGQTFTISREAPAK